MVTTVVRVRFGIFPDRAQQNPHRPTDTLTKHTLATFTPAAPAAAELPAEPTDMCDDNVARDIDERVRKCGVEANDAADR